MNERIKKIMESKKFTSTQFSDEIGIQRSSLSHILSGRNKPSLDFMLKVKARFPEINLDWLLLGNGIMVEENLPEIKIEENRVGEPGSEISPEVGLFSETKENQVQANEKYETIAKSEEQAGYQLSTDALDRKPEKVIILYNDQTFSVYTEKG